MTNKEFAAFLEAAKITPHRFHKITGMDYGRVTRMISGESQIPAYVGLTCTAISWGLKEWTPGAVGGAVLNDDTRAAADVLDALPPRERAAMITAIMSMGARKSA